MSSPESDVSSPEVAARSHEAGRRRPVAGARLLLRPAGAGLLVATASMHLDLYLTGYRTIPTIGLLFLLQVIAGFALGAAVLVTGDRLVAAGGAVFALSTLGGYLLSVQFGLFGFREVRTTAGIVAGIVEVAAFAALAAFATGPEAGAHRRHARLPRAQHAGTAVAVMQHAGTAVAVVSVLALALLGGALAGAGGAGGAAAAGALATRDIKGAIVLTNSAGRTLYWFAPDTSTKSTCYGSCAQYWPPVPGPDKAGNGVTGTLGTIRRADGSLQETYDGHPLYTYIGDSAPGQANGNDVDLNGGYWHEMLASG
jgi:predicted lipoprotein with Yx(FWY)xxD motif